MKKKCEYKKVEDKDMDIETKAKMILDSSTFNSYIQSLNLEPIDKVRERFNKLRKDTSEAVEYIRSGQQEKDLMRLELETGKVENKNKLGKFIVNLEPEFIRKMYGPKKVIKFYEKDFHTMGKQVGLENFNNKTSAATMLQSIQYKLRGFTRYAAVLDEATFNLGVEPRNKISRKLYELSYKLPADKCASQIKRIKVMAAEIQSPQDIGRVTTKDYKPLAEQIIGHEKGIGTFLKKIEDMAKLDPKDTFKDKMVKQIYTAFVAQMKHHETDTPQDIISINKEADKIIEEVTKAVKPVDSLIAMVDKYKRLY